MKQAPKQNKELSVGFLIFLIVFTTVIGVLLINDLNSSIPEKYKFDKEVWGNVSDWFTYIVSTIGIAFIAKTFNSQMVVQKEQEKINKLNSYDVRSKYLPKIETNQLPISNLEVYYKKESLRQLFFTIKEHHALNIVIKSRIKFTPYHEGKLYTVGNDYYCDLTKISKGVTFYLVFDDEIVTSFFEGVKSNGIDPIIFTNIEFFYEDNFGFKYHVTFTYEYQPFTKFVTIRESNIDYLD